MNMRERLKANTANLTPAANRDVANSPDDNRPKTGIGIVNKLSQADRRIAEADRRIAELEAALEAKGTQATIPVSKIHPNPWQPRTRFVQSALDELAESIREVGLMQPILVRAVPAQEGVDAHFQIVAGERRWRAHQLIGAEEIKVLMVEVTDADMAVLALTENVIREDLTDFEISRGMVRAEKEFPNRKRMAEDIGIARSALYRYLAFAKLPQFMLDDLEKKPEIFGGNAAHDTSKMLEKHGARAEPVAKDLWQQLVAGSLDQTKFAAILDATLARKDASPATIQRDIHKVYAGKVQAGSITKDPASFTVKLKSNMLTAAQEERIRALVAELFAENQSAT